MPRLSVWMIRSAFLHLGFGVTIGAGLLWQKGPGGIPWVWGWLPLHIHVVLVGWTVQLATGVAYWILPRFARRQDEASRFEQERGREGLAWATYMLLNSSTLAALLSLGAWSTGLIVASILAVVGGVLFAVHAWPRVKPFMV